MATSSLLPQVNPVDVPASGITGEAPGDPAKRRGLNTLGLVLPGVALVAWEAAARFGWLDRTITSSPSEILGVLDHLLTTGQIWEHLWATSGRVFSGFALGGVVALVLGAITGTNPIAYRILNPSINAIRSVPSYAWVPLFILWFGIFETSKILLIALGAFFPLYLALVSSIRGVDRKLVEVGLVNGFRGWSLVRRIFLPASLPPFSWGYVRASVSPGCSWWLQSLWEQLTVSDSC
jgi:sulfonate transport system permease protein